VRRPATHGMCASSVFAGKGLLRQADVAVQSADRRRRAGEPRISAPPRRGAGHGRLHQLFGWADAALLRRPLVIHERIPCRFEQQVLARVAQKTLSGFPDVLSKRSGAASACAAASPITRAANTLCGAQRQAERAWSWRQLGEGAQRPCRRHSRCCARVCLRSPSNRPTHFAAVQRLHHRPGAATSAPSRRHGRQLRDADVVNLPRRRMTIAELAAAGVEHPDPVPVRGGDHQTHNARFLSGGALAVAAERMSAEKLAQLLPD